MTLHPAADRELDLASIPVVIHDAGFRPSDFRIRAHGRVETEPSPCFRIRGWSACLPLVQPPHQPLPDASEDVQLEADVIVDGAEVSLDPR